MLFWTFGYCLGWIYCTRYIGSVCYLPTNVWTYIFGTYNVRIEYLSKNGFCRNWYICNNHSYRSISSECIARILYQVHHGVSTLDSLVSSYQQIFACSLRFFAYSDLYFVLKTCIRLMCSSSTCTLQVAHRSSTHWSSLSISSRIFCADGSSIIFVFFYLGTTTGLEPVSCWVTPQQHLPFEGT